MDFELNDLTSGLLWTSQAHRLSLVDFLDGLELVAQFFENVRRTTSAQSLTCSFCPPPRTLFFGSSRLDLAGRLVGGTSQGSHFVVSPSSPGA